MTDFKITTWMSDWSDEDHAAYRSAWEIATSSDPDHDSGPCSLKWLELVMDAASSESTWAADVLADMQRRGALESWKAAPVELPRIQSKSRMVKVNAAAPRRSGDGKRGVNVQTTLFDMTRPELVQVAATNRENSQTFAAKAHLVTRLIKIVDDAIALGAPKTLTARQAAEKLGIDLSTWNAA